MQAGGLALHGDNPLTGAADLTGERCLVMRGRMIRAARGDADAQRLFAVDYYYQAHDMPEGTARAFALQQAIMWARLVEANTRSLGDAGLLAHVLGLAADTCDEMGDERGASGFRAEVMGLLDRAADLQGGEEADCGLLVVAPLCTPHELQEAKAERAYYDA